MKGEVNFEGEVISKAFLNVVHTNVNIYERKMRDIFELDRVRYGSV